MDALELRLSLIEQLKTIDDVKLLTCKAAKKKLSKKLLAVIGTAAFVGAILAVILIARTPMPL